MQFPSPIGVLYISIFNFNLIKHRAMFPSPIGSSLYFNTDNEIINNALEQEVSVPYWGSLYFNEKGKRYAYSN